jgi:hypothetical protein
MTIKYCQNIKPLEYKTGESVMCGISGERCIADFCVADLIRKRGNNNLMSHEYNPSVAKRCILYSDKIPCSQQLIRKIKKERAGIRKERLIDRLRNFRAWELIING